MHTEKRNWVKIALSYRGSVIPEILPRATFCGVFGLVIHLLHTKGFPVSLPALDSLIPNIVMGLLLVFRTNTAYDRFWEGRKAWGSIVNSVRNLARSMLIAITEKDPEDFEQKTATLRLLAAFAVSMKLHLRHEPLNTQIEALLSPSQYVQLQKMNHPPLEIAFWIGDYLQKQQELGNLDRYQLTAMQKLLNYLVDALGVCERIQKTPMPLAYSIHLKQLLLIYCLSLPFQMVSAVGWLTGPTVALISFTVFGIEEIGIQIEDPFGLDANDLPLDNICQNLHRNIEDLITLEPSRRKYLKDPLGSYQT
ncbi:bestrophin family protein [Pseudanabaena sp. PCC 6802]|uniref:bestrophin family protein n=1 Tax=Pseudanabaena sp. PCC 6802 TaxID=118173 RepID=UPI00034491CD|nr:bestrophin family ion channel [Pseudanabaena sp. PCC 6802]